MFSNVDSAASGQRNETETNAGFVLEILVRTKLYNRRRAPRVESGRRFVLVRFVVKVCVRTMLYTHCELQTTARNMAVKKWRRAGIFML